MIAQIEIQYPSSLLLFKMVVTLPESPFHFSCIFLSFLFLFLTQIGETEMLQTFHLLQSFNFGFLPFMLLIELFWWSIKLSFLICLQICQISYMRKVQNQWWVEHFQIIFNKHFLYWSHLQILQLKVNLNNWEFTKKSLI